MHQTQMEANKKQDTPYPKNRLYPQTYNVTIPPHTSQINRPAGQPEIHKPYPESEPGSEPEPEPDT